MNKIAKLLGAVFDRPPPDPHRKARDAAKLLAGARGFAIERVAAGGFNVLPPKDLADSDADPYRGDHFCSSWDAVLIRSQAYAAIQNRAPFKARVRAVVSPND